MLDASLDINPASQGRDESAVPAGTVERLGRPGYLNGSTHARLFEVRPRALNQRSIAIRCQQSTRLSGAQSQNRRSRDLVRRLAKTSERTSMRCSSRPLIVTKPISASRTSSSEG